MQTAPNLEALTNLRVLNESFERTLRAENLATASVTLYTGGVRYFQLLGGPWHAYLRGGDRP
jgi:hypothetical protein